MTEHSKIRADIDTELVKGLLLINGGAAVALLTFLPHVLDKPDFEPLARAILWGLLVFQLGLVFSVIHNRLRRKCSLAWEQSNFAPAPCKVLGITLSEPCLCHWSTLFMWLSIATFVGGGVMVFCGGTETLNKRAASIHEAKATPPSELKSLPNPAVQGTLRDKAAQRP